MPDSDSKTPSLAIGKTDDAGAGAQRFGPMMRPIPEGDRAMPAPSDLFLANRAGGRPRVSVVVPCYDEEQVLPALMERLSRVCRDVVGGSYEIVFVNDGSHDRTWALIEGMSRSDPRVVGVDLARNFGHQKALTSGLAVCRGERVFVIDADLQDPPELLGDMMRLMDAGADVVYGQRMQRKGESLFKRTTAAVFYRLLTRVTSVSIPQDTGDFRLMTRQVVEALQSVAEEHRFVRGLVAWLGFQQVALPYERAERAAGVTKYPLHKMINFAIDAITSFSILPLRIAGYVALLGFLAIFPLMAYVFYSVLRLGVVPGWASVMAMVVTFGSMQLLVLGIMGEYVGRTYIQSKNRPLYIIRQLATRDTLGEAAAPADKSRTRAVAV